MPQPVPASDSISSDISSAPVEVLLSEDRSGDSAPVDLVASSKYRGMDYGSGTSNAEPGRGSAGASRFMWRQVFVRVAIMLPLILLIFLIWIVGSQ